MSGRRNFAFSIYEEIHKKFSLKSGKKIFSMHFLVKKNCVWEMFGKVLFDLSLGKHMQ